MGTPRHGPWCPQWSPGQPCHTSIRLSFLDVPSFTWQPSFFARKERGPVDTYPLLRACSPLLSPGNEGHANWCLELVLRQLAPCLCGCQMLSQRGMRRGCVIRCTLNSRDLWWFSAFSLRERGGKFLLFSDLVGRRVGQLPMAL